MMSRQEQVMGKVLPWLLIVVAALFPPYVSASDKMVYDILNDQRNFYSKERLVRLGLAFGVGGIFANTSFDEDIQNYYQERIRNSDTDTFSKRAKVFGEGKYLLPLSLALASLSAIDEDCFLGEFGGKTLRSYIAGGIPVLAMQRITGAGRPEKQEHGSKWHPLENPNGVSGHAFIGAVPFLVAARMSDNTFQKIVFYAASLATPLSRVNDNAHYTSQSFLGWYLAYESTEAVFETERNNGVAFAPMLGNNSYGISFFTSW